MIRRPMKWSFLGAALAATAALGAGCGGESDSSFSRADADTVVEVTLRDFVFEGLPAEIKGGKVFFATTNTGPDDHELEILKPDGEALGEIPLHGSGQARTLAVRLDPGTYTVQCILKTAKGQVHADLGMTAPLVVR